MNLHRCRSCGLKLETGDICQRCQDIDALARDVFDRSTSKKIQTVSQWANDVAIDQIELAQQRASSCGICSFSMTPPEEAFSLAQRRITFYPTKGIIMVVNPRRVAQLSKARFFDDKLGIPWNED